MRVKQGNNKSSGTVNNWNLTRCATVRLPHVSAP